MDSKLRTSALVSFTRQNSYLTSTRDTDGLEDSDAKVKFFIGSEEIPADSRILSAFSPKYRSQFSPAMYKNNVFVLKNVSSAGFKEFQQFSCKNEVTLTLENIEDVLDLAKQSLVDEIAHFLINMVGLDKFLFFYRLALRFHMELLKECCTNAIETNVGAVFKTADFLKCEKEILRNILTIDLRDCNESEIFDACVSWARAQCEKHELDGDQSVNLRAVLGEALYKIRFYSMSIEEYSTISELYPELLTTKESHDVLRAIVELKFATNDEASNLFGENSGYIIQRNSMVKKFIEISPLECPLSSNGIRISYDSIQDNNDCIGFCCDAEISLRGIVLFNEIYNDIEVMISTLYWSKKPDHLKIISNNETKITFDYPIHIDGNGWCYIIVRPKYSKESSPCTPLDGFRVDSKTQRGGVTFEIVSQNAQESNLITRLLFNIVDKK